LVGEAWGLQCALCPRRDEGTHTHTHTHTDVELCISADLILAQTAT